ncbi:hypothetical protein LJC46_08235 [Desulfovibrio sp. OttesenSCG-928-G15]|nr:hypothetical protein [Desulfovibrio sp. OttesenSCG-928-G15]
MSCVIDSNWNADGMPEAFNSVNRKARKEHKCFECGRKILPGEMYCYESGIWEGTPGSFKTCLDCASVREALFCSFVYGGLWYDVRTFVFDFQDELPWAKFSQFTPAARAKVCEIVEGIWGDDDEEGE